MPVKSVPTMGWTRRSAAVSVLLVLDEHRKQVGVRVVQLRDAQRWSQEDLAHHAKVSVKTISRIEQGKHEGRRSTIKSIARALEVEEDDLLGTPPAPLGLSSEPNQLDRLETKVDELTAEISGLTRLLADVTRQTTQTLENEVGKADLDTPDEEDAKTEPSQVPPEGTTDNASKP